jgi:uncharacterized protein YcfJ
MITGEGKATMQRPILQGILLVAAALASIGAVAGFVAATSPDFAQVVSVSPVTEAVKVKRQECRDATAAGRQPDAHRAPGTVIGGMVGGFIGQSSAGSPAPGSPQSGARTQKAAPDPGSRAGKRGQCRIVNRAERQVVAYDVRYRFEGRTGSVRMDHKPGSRIPVRDGRLVLSGAAPAGPDGDT